MSLSCIVCEIKRDIGRKSLCFIFHLHSTSRLRGLCRNFAIIFRTKNRMVRIPEGGKMLRINLLVLIKYTNVSYRQTDGRRASHRAIRPRLCIEWMKYRLTVSHIAVLPITSTSRIDQINSRPHQPRSAFTLQLQIISLQATVTLIQWQD